MIYPESIWPWVELQCGNIDHTNHPASYHNSLGNTLKYLENWVFNRYDYDCVTDSVSITWADVGSGIGGIDVALATVFSQWIRNDYEGDTKPNLDIHLIDGDSCPTPKHFIHRKPFNSMAVAKEFFQANGFDFTPHIETDENLPELDFVLSFASWGFHFPISTYPNVLKQLKPGGLCIVDLRTNKDYSLDFPPSRFIQINIENISPKKARHVYKKILN